MSSHEDERFQYQEGKIWALECLLGAALQVSGIGDQPLDALIEQARQGYPASRDPDGPIGKGFNETITHALNWRNSASRTP